MGQQADLRDALLRWYIARMRADATARTAHRSLTPLTLVDRDKQRIQDLVMRSGAARNARAQQIIEQLEKQAENQGWFTALMKSGDLAVRHRAAMTALLSALDENCDLLDAHSWMIDDVANLLVQQLAAARQGERLLMDSSPYILAALDEELRLLETNLEFELKTNYAVSDLLGAPITRFIPASDQDEFKCKLAAIKKREPTNSFQTGLLTKAADMIDIEWHVEWSESASSYFCQGRDITELRRQERLREEISAMVRHDLRIPVSAVALILENIQTGVYGELSDAGVAKLQQAQDSVAQMVRLIDGLLDAEKLDAGKMKLNATTFSLDELFKSCSSVFSPVTAVVVFPAGDATSVHADFDYCRRVLLNLIDNAVKYSPLDKNVVVSVFKKVGAVQIRVTDEGPGIPESLRDEVFSRFSSSREGTGLGLYIAKRFVELHGGEIGFDTGAKGTTFWFSLPL